MNGIEFFILLRNIYNRNNRNNQVLYNQYLFCRWITKRDGSLSFQFNGNTPRCRANPFAWF